MAIEPWLREIDLGLHPALAQPVFALQQVQEDLDHHTAGLTVAQVWLAVQGVTPLGFHLRHIAGSTDRLTTYLRGDILTDAQLAELKAEKTPGMSRQELLRQVADSIAKAEAAIRALDPAKLAELRFIGRNRIRTTASGLAIHIGEHAQRHTGQAITVCQLLRGLYPQDPAEA
jgi:hypothetical protein